MKKMILKISLCFGLFLLLLLFGCIDQRSSPLLEVTSTPELTAEPIQTVLVPSFTPVHQTPVRSATVLLTDTPEARTPTFSPTTTPEISLFQEIQSLPKGTYTLVIGNTGHPEEYAYLLLKDTGEVVKKFNFTSMRLVFQTTFAFLSLTMGGRRLKIFGWILQIPKKFIIRSLAIVISHPGRKIILN